MNPSCAAFHLCQFFRAGNPFLWCAVIQSVLFFVFAHRLYPARPQPATQQQPPAVEKQPEPQKPRWHVLHALPAGLGPFAGWIAFGYLWIIDWTSPRWEYLVVTAIAFLGIGGALPRAAFVNWLFQSDKPQQINVELRRPS
jgi:hypothetical protein